MFARETSARQTTRNFIFVSFARHTLQIYQNAIKRCLRLARSQAPKNTQDNFGSYIVLPGQDPSQNKSHVVSFFM